MKHYVLLGVVVVVLSACAKRPTVPVQGVGQVVTSSVMPLTSNGKFALGPHQGLLNTRQFYFRCNSTLLPKAAYAALDAHAQYLKADPSARIELQGFTSAKGSHEYNITVGERRANSVKDFMALHGARVEQLTTVSYGEEQAYPLSERKDAQDCRVDLIYTAA